MMDFQKLCEHFLTDVYKESTRSYKTSKSFIRSLRRAPAREDGDIEPRHLIAANVCEAECFCVIQKLSERRTNALLIIDDLSEQKRKLVEQEEEFQQRFIEFNEQISQNHQKRERAIGRSENCKIVVGEQNIKIEKLSNEVAKLRQYSDRMMEEIKKNLIYEEYLQSTLYDFGPKASPSDVITRYLALESKKRYLIVRNVALNDRLNKTCQESLDRTCEYRNKIIEMRGQISLNAVRYDEAVNRANQLECLLISVWAYCAEKLEDTILSAQAIRNLNEMIHKRSTVRNPPGTSYEQPKNMPPVIHEVVAIKNTMRALANVMRKVEMRLRMVRKLWSQGQYEIFHKSPIL